MKSDQETFLLKTRDLGKVAQMLFLKKNIHILVNTHTRSKRPGEKFCVSVFRQNQEYHIINVQDWGLFPLVTAFPGGRDGMRAGRRECRPNLPGILMQGDQPTFRSANMISN